MKNTNVKVITFGVFDILHFGHLRLFQNIKKQVGQNSFLVVCVQDSNSVLKYKPNAKMIFNTEERVEILKSVKYIDDIKIYSDVDIDIKNVEFDILAVGEDQNHSGFKNAIDWCKDFNKQVIEIPRTKGICSSLLK